MSDGHFVPPNAPSDLCFDGNEFIEPNFDVDTFLHNHRGNASLEIMRDDLGVYLKILRSAMIELINKDYADFVNLSSNLIGLDKAIDRLQAPLGQLREEVMQIRQTLDDATNEMSDRLEEHRKIREYKQSLHSLGRVYKSLAKLSLILATCELKPDMLERAATEFNQLKFHSSRCQDNIGQEHKKKCEELDNRLMESLSELLITCVNKRETEQLKRCLQIYVTLDKIKEAEILARIRIVGPALESIIMEKNLQNEPSGLHGIYQRLINFLNTEMHQLLVVTTGQDRNCVKGFNFLVNSFWPEVEQRIELNLKLIFAPGNPELFHGRYVETLEFLNKLQQECDCSETLASLKAHPLYKQFLKKWNLPVYFQIRFQEIAGGLEEVLHQPISPLSMKNQISQLATNDYSLHATCVTWDCLLKIWTDGIFLPQLLHQFWKLSLQIISRYQTWCINAVKQPWPSPPQTPTTSNVIEAVGTTKLEFLVCLHNDAEKLLNNLPSLLDIAKSKLLNIKTSTEELLRDSLEESQKNLDLALPNISEKIVSELLADAAPKLKQVSDIPRLFRRTMREKPTQPCAYVKNALSNLNEFQRTYKKSAPNAVNKWLKSTLSSLTEQYSSSVKDVLESVQKTEESLRRLKKIRDKSSGVSLSESQGISDDEKIRVQLEIDVRSYAETVGAFEIPPTEVPNLEELLRVVQEAVKNKS
ncbi:conserved oligomeric Golgi complex subunit 2 [Venturia canescens]|uniref:conserved oligomeric Golgi complex subunit 2 n=1 Tax=Venturia canescens TaxID=32260 RepID=UPI001C9C8907|nr:conserved oligomeric Golgi complex subunit 2 [Venturia canescens]